jgi:hypothetical protein
MKRRLTLTAFVLLAAGGLIQSDIAPDLFEHTFDIRTPRAPFSSSTFVLDCDAPGADAVVFASEIAKPARTGSRGLTTLTLLAAGAFARLRRRCEVTNL